MELSKAQKIQQQIINEAWENEAFKANLIADPVAAIEKLIGEKLDLQGKELIVRDQTDENTIYINIPPEQRIKDVELSDAQLEAVAGGTEKPGHSELQDLLGGLQSFRIM